MSVSTIKRFRSAWLLIAVPHLAHAQSPPATPSSSPTVIRAAKLVDVRSGNVMRNPIVVVQGTRISAVGTDVAVPAGARLVDLGNVTLLPGLIDAHSHLLANFDFRLGSPERGMILTIVESGTAQRALFGAAKGREDLEAGITTVRDLGNSGLNGDVALRDAINAGWVPGPRIQASTRILSPTGGQLGRLSTEAQKLIEQEYVAISGVEEARRAVRQALYDGADVIKVVVSADPRILSLDEMRVIVEEAHRAGKRVAAHADGDQATRIAAEAGVNSIEHAWTVPDDALRMMAQKKIVLVVTDYPAAFNVDGLGVQRSPEVRARALAAFEEFAHRNADRLRRAMRMGVKIAYGSDTYFNTPGRTRGQASLVGLQTYQDAGMPALDVLRAATINAAELLGWEDRIGAIETGKFADIIAVDGDPLTDVKDVYKIRFVMKGGQIIRHDAERK